MRFSVIVPIYKVEAYLCACIESVLSQSFRDFELILVDDGSPDQCPAICDEYAGKDNRIHVIHQQNKGVSAARNHGILAAEGEYIAFLDGDDLLCEKAFEQMDQCLLENGVPDLVIGNIVYWDAAGERTIDYEQGLGNQAEGKSLLELNEVYAQQHIQLPWSAYQHIYSRSFLHANGFCFDNRLTRAEDTDFYLKVIQCVSTYVLTDICLVKYRLNRAGSVITAPTPQSVWGSLIVFSTAFNQAGIFPNEALMRSYFADYFANAVLLIAELDKKAEREPCYQFVQKNRRILSFTSSRPEYAAGKAVWRIMGLKMGTRLLMRVKKLYKYARFCARKCASRLKGD